MKGLGRSMKYRLKESFLQTKFLLENSHTTTAIIPNIVFLGNTQTGFWRNPCSNKMINPINGGMSEGRSMPSCFFPVEIGTGHRRMDYPSSEGGG